MNITVIGSGYVGTTAAALFANAGYNVVVLDVSEQRVDSVNSGEAPFFEIGLDKLIKSGIQSGKLTATTNYKEALGGVDVVFSCVGTPDNPDGSSNLEYVHQAAKEASQHISQDVIYVQKSTVPVGTGREVIKALPAKVQYVSNPEFLREGTAITDTLLSDRVVAGGDNRDAVETVLDIHRCVSEHAHSIAPIAGLDINEKTTNHQGAYISTGLESAELIKVTANAFLALKISFANSIAQLSDKVGADVTEVMEAVGADKRIGRAFLNAGRGYGGGCFPKDVSGLIRSAESYKVSLPIMSAATAVNESMPGYIIENTRKIIGSFSDKNVTVLGLSFKAGTSDTRKSPAIAIANKLYEQDAAVGAYDPKAVNEAMKHLDPGVQVFHSINDSLSSSTDIVFVTTDWPEFKEMKWLTLIPQSTLIVDCMNCLDKTTIEAQGFTYIGVGR